MDMRIGAEMGDNLKDVDIPAPKVSSEEVLTKWEKAVSFVKNFGRRFRTVTDLDKQLDQQNQLDKIQEKLRVTMDVMKAAESFMQQRDEKDYSFEDVFSATNVFYPVNLTTTSKLGEMHKGQIMQLGKLIDVVVRMFNQQGDELLTEISMLSSLKHENIVSLVGFCDEKDKKFIIYEQAFHGILEQHLSDPTLTWSRRVHICLDVARAMNHIHYDVIHCDINSSKIFLDKDWKAKIFGFELSTKYPQSWRHRLLFSDDATSITPKYDVHSFGVLMFEVFSGVKSMIGEDSVNQELDYINIYQEDINMESVELFKKTARDCLKPQLVERPTMDQIVKELQDVLELQQKHENLGHSTVAHESISSNHLKIPLSEIEKATQHFKETCKIGSGGFGTVYKAELCILDIKSLPLVKEKSKDQPTKTNKTVAIKRIRGQSGEQGFLAEIKLLSSCIHPNIVSLLGFSNDANEMILVYEYAYNGSLSNYLVSTQKIHLTWVQRIQICLDIARGLSYLHTELEGKPSIIHRDIKSDNILLDENLNAKVADFGLSKFHANQVNTIQSSKIAGTPYYMDPEFSSTGKYKRETDIYSFGVVLFEILSGRLAYDSNFIKENKEGLAPIARRRFNEGTLKELIDPTMIEEDENIFTLNRGPNENSFNVFSKVAYQCLAETQAKRPTMEVVIKELKNALESQGETMVLSRFRIADIELATDKFSKKYCIGQDPNGIVYKAELDHFGSNNNDEPSKKLIVAVIKRILGKDGQGKQAFFDEIEMRTSYKHPNIVSLLGFCNEGGNMILVYEHASNGSLDDYLKRGNSNMKDLTWTRRLRMCLQIARGLDHLHTTMNTQQQRIIHGDIRSANILLGKNWEPKIAYFGISKSHQANEEENTHVTHSSVVTKVYSDPQYEKTSELRKESDVYSFGVILFEIFCGKLAYHTVYLAENVGGLAPIACRCFIDGTIKNMMDPKLKKEIDEEVFTLNRVPNQDSMDTFLEIAHLCLGEATKRPTLETVIRKLETALNFQEIFQQEFQISFEDIKLATGNFCENNFFRRGTYWKEYTGAFPFPHDNDDANERTTIVAKRWDSQSGQGDRQFLTELDFLFKHKHDNIIDLVGYCKEMNETIIVYKHPSNGSLDMHLDDASLTWMERIRICIDVAKGLDFLHRGAIKTVFHRDIKSSSILLYDDWKAKISNLELSSLYSLEHDMEHISDNALCYLHPQYEQGFLPEKSDMYSFGVVLFEILCGRLARAEGCKDHYQCLGPLAKKSYKERKLNEMVFQGIKEQIGPKSLTTFAGIAYQCLHDHGHERPTASEVVIGLEEALDAQEDYKEWESKLPKDYKKVIQMSKNPEIYSTLKRKDLYDILSKGILIQEGKLWFSLGRNGESNKMVSASQFSYENHRVLLVQESRFRKIVKMFDISNLKIKIQINTQLLSPDVNYGVHLIFKFCGARKSPADEQMFVNLTYKMGNETLHAYFATRRENDWMTIEFYRFTNHNEDADFEFLLESLSQYCCESSAIYVEGIEFRAIENVKHEEGLDTNLNQVQKVLNSTPKNLLGILSIIAQSPWKLLNRRYKKNHYMLSAKEALCNSSNVKIFSLKPSIESRFHEMIELRSTRLFCTKCKIDSQMLLPNREYVCYLVFKLSEKCRGLHFPVIVRDLHQPKSKQILYFRSPSHWNLNDVSQVPNEREDGWMEVNVWKFKSDNDCISLNLRFISCEGTMYGFIVCGFEFRPM